MQEKKPSPLSFIKIPSLAGIFAKKASPQGNHSGQAPRLYRTIHDLPLDKFISALCDQDFNALVISGNPSQEELSQAWDEIFLDYLDLNGDNDARMDITLAKDIAILSARLQQIETCLFFLQVFHVQEVADILTDIGFEDVSLDPSDLEQYFENLNIIRLRSKEIKIDIELKEIELTELRESKKKTPAKRADRSSFLNILSRIATYKHTAVIRASEISVAEFCAMFAEYLDHIKALKVSADKKPG
jgi:hypothetical protein